MSEIITILIGGAVHMGEISEKCIESYSPEYRQNQASVDKTAETQEIWD